MPNASVATKTRLIKIYETILINNVQDVVNNLVHASEIYGRINLVIQPDKPTTLDHAFKRLMRAKGSPSYQLIMWLISKQAELELSDDRIAIVVDWLINFFVRRNLTGSPATNALDKLFMGTIDAIEKNEDQGVLDIIASRLRAVSSSDEVFRERLSGRIYEENSDVARYILTTLAEDAMTKETTVDLWRQESNRFVWSIEHILPQGDNIPAEWQKILGGADVAPEVHEEQRHRLGNLTITAYNGNLSNKSFIEKRDRTDSQGRLIGYRNGFTLNEDLAEREVWTARDIEERTKELADQAITRFPLAG